MSSVHTLKFPPPMEKCFVEGCNEQTFRKCIICKKPCCPTHKSKANADYCQDCLTAETTKIEESPLVDTLGVTHEGRVLRPIGQFYVTFPGYVHELSKELLDRCIEEYAARVHEARTTLERSQICLTVAQTEKADREQQATHVKTRRPGLTFGAENGKTVTLGAAQNKQHRAQQVIERLKASGLSQDEILQMIKAVVAKRQVKP